MSTYTKERNIIVITLDGKNGNYRLDLSNGTFYGLSGKAVKTYSSREAYKDLFRPNRATSNLARALFTMFDHCGGKTEHFTNFLTALAGAERMDAINAPILENSRTEYYSEINEYFTDFTEYVRTLGEGSTNFLMRDFRAYLNYKENTKFLSPQMRMLFTPDMINGVIDSFGKNLSAEMWDLMAYYLVRGKYWEYHDGNLYSLRQYIHLCGSMNKTPQKVNNFMREYIETVREYERRKTEYDNNRIYLNYAKHANAFNFEYGDFVVVLPQSGQDIIDEGDNMHHCVGGYVNRVIENSTYIIFVRHKDTPKKCYITCQVSTEGKIGQYFLAYDHYISTDEDKAFKEALQEHLTAHWND